MNSLIGLGAATSFTAGTASLLLPGAGLEIGFLEEPVMLLAFVLLGRALETRARLRASGTSQLVSIFDVTISFQLMVGTYWVYRNLDLSANMPVSTVDTKLHPRGCVLTGATASIVCQHHCPCLATGLQTLHVLFS